MDQGQLREEEGNEHLPTVLNIPEQELTSRLEQLRRKESEEHRLHEQLRERENHKQKLWQTEEELINCREQLQQKESEKARLHVHSRKIEKEYDYLRKSFEEREAQVTNLQTQLMEKEQQLEYLHQGIANQEKQLRDQEQDMAGLQTALSTAMQKLSEYESQLKTRDWVISRDQIQVNVDKCLGEGGWGRVVEGTYCGCAVAIKYLHKSTLTPQERRVFEREMDIASRCRHPCLLQFIGATKDDKQSPLFVTELMESSLRTLIRQRQLSETHLSETEISVISLDVARALNYLHQRKPTPIVHRDVSSANVLLWRRGDQWRGKVSDYGTAKFVQEIMTVSPGALIYSAPEAGSPFNQTVKVSQFYLKLLHNHTISMNIPMGSLFIWMP